MPLLTFSHFKLLPAIWSIQESFTGSPLLSLPHSTNNCCSLRNLFVATFDLLDKSGT